MDEPWKIALAGAAAGAAAMYCLGATSKATDDAYDRPGCLGDPDSEYLTDPRSDRRVLEFWQSNDFGGRPDVGLATTAESPLADQLEWARTCEFDFQKALGDCYKGTNTVIEGVVNSTVTIEGEGGFQIVLHVSKPQNAPGPLPCIYHTHGGGMCILKATDLPNPHLRDSYAAAGLVVIGVEYRNSAGQLGVNPFPQGLNDSFAGLEYVYANKKELGISKIVVSGESGGGNMACALALKANKEGKMHLIDGAVPQCPYISGAYSKALRNDRNLLSFKENGAHWIGMESLALFAFMYDPSGKHTTDPLAWPYHAGDDDVRGLPPHLIIVNELDPLRDEGIWYYRNLQRNGVNARCVQMHGTTHSSNVFEPCHPSMFHDTVDAVKSFAYRL